MATTLKVRVARWVACVVAVGACVMGAGVPASVGDPLPTPSVPVAASPETPVLPGHVVTISVMVHPTTIKTPDGTYQLSIHMGMAFYGEKSQAEKFAQEECQFLADTFWSGSAPDYFVNELRPETWTRLMVAVMRLPVGSDPGILPGSGP